MNFAFISRAFAEMERLQKMVDASPTPLMDVWKGVRVGGRDNNSGPLRFTDPEITYTFAMGIVEGRFVFVNDSLFNRNGDFINISSNDFKLDGMSFMKPKATFMYNGVEYKKPKVATEEDEDGFYIGGRDANFGLGTAPIRLYYDDIEHRSKIEKLILSIMGL